MPTKPNRRNESSPRSYHRLFQACGVLVPDDASGEVCVGCPSCDKEKLYCNVAKGVYDCKTCEFKGNALELFRWHYNRSLESTGKKQLDQLASLRHIDYRTLQRWGIVYDCPNNVYLLPMFNCSGELIGGQQYEYSKRTGCNKYNLQGLKSGLFGLNRLSQEKDKLVVLCEGIFDAMMLDYQLKNNRAKYDILALPGSNYKALSELLKGRKVRTVFDNDDGGEKHRQAVTKHLAKDAAELHQVFWPENTPAGYDLCDFVQNNPSENLIGWTRKHAVKCSETRQLRFLSGTDLLKSESYRRRKSWIWKDHIPTRCYISMSGYQGTMKSTICRDLAARVTKGSKMPDGSKLGVEPSDVLYVSAEDEIEDVLDSFLEHGGDPGRIHIHGLQIDDGEEYVLNLLRDLPEIGNRVKQSGAKLVIVDGQNSLLGDADYSSDAKARSQITNKLVAFAQKYDVALIGIRNETRDGHKLGASAMQDQGRCVMRTDLVKQNDRETNYFTTFLQFEKVSGAPTPAPLCFVGKDMGTNERGWRRLRIEWETKRDYKKLREAFSSPYKTTV